MRAIVLDKPRQPLQLRDVEKPRPAKGQLLVRIVACAVCRTDLHVADGELPDPKLPLIPGHQIVGRVEEIGEEVNSKFKIGDRVGIPWLGWTDGECTYCRFVFHLPDRYNDVEVAPLLCAGLIGYRSYRKTGDARRLGIYGFGNAAHLIAQIALHEGRDLFVFTRPGDMETQQNAKTLGAKWAGGSDEMPPEKLDAAIVFASVGPLVPAALRALANGGIVVCGGIHMTDIPSFPYVDLWNERIITSVANLTRHDAEEFFKIASRVPIQTKTEVFPLEDANIAIEEFRRGELVGTAVLEVPAS